MVLTEYMTLFQVHFEEGANRSLQWMLVTHLMSPNALMKFYER